jgi:hypothetical protein
VSNGLRLAGKKDVVLFKLSARTGGRLWTRQFGTSQVDEPFGVSFEPNTQHLYVSGRSSGGARTSGQYAGQMQSSVEVEPGVQSSGVRAPHSSVAVGDRSFLFLVKYNASDGRCAGTMIDGGISFSKAALIVTEGGLQDYYTVVLRREPTHDVTVEVSPVLLRTRPQIDLSVGALVFSPKNWTLPQTVRVTARNDYVDEGLHFTTVIHSASSSDPNYNGDDLPFLGGSNVTVTVADDDNAMIVIAKSAVFPTEGGANDSYGVYLATEPMDTVTVVVKGTDQAVVSPKELVFTPQDWNVRQNVTVMAVDDRLSENVYGGTHAGGNIRHLVSSKDAMYNTRQPFCYYVPRCRCAARPELNETVSVAPGYCGNATRTHCANTTSLLCDVDPTNPDPLAQLYACDNHDYGNGHCENKVLPDGKYGPTVTTIPPRFSAADPNPNPPNSTIVDVGIGLEQIEVKYGAGYFMPDPIDSGHGFVHTPHPKPFDFNAEWNPNVHPRSQSFGAVMNLSVVPADVIGHMLGFLGVLSLDAAYALAASGSNVIKNAICRGLQRLSLQKWAQAEWPPGMAEKVLKATFIAFPNTTQADLSNCGSAHFSPSSSVMVAVADNDPGVTLSKLYFTVKEGGSNDTYTVVLNAPPVSNASERLPNATHGSWRSVTKLCTEPCVYAEALPAASTQEQCYRPEATVPCASAAAFPRPLVARWPGDMEAGHPGGAVTVAVIGNAQVRAEPPFLTFTTTDWNVPQTVTVSAVDDAVAEGVENHTIGHFISSADPAYGGLKTVVWAGPYPNPNPEPSFWNGAMDSSFNPQVESR